MVCDFKLGSSGLMELQESAKSSTGEISTGSQDVSRFALNAVIFARLWKFYDRQVFTILVQRKPQANALDEQTL